MLLLALRGLVAARRRLVATGLAVALGVALATGSLVLGRAIDRDLRASAASPAQAADVVVRQRVALRSTLGPVRARLPRRVLEAVRATPGVGAAEGVVQGFAQPLGPDGVPLPGPSRSAGRVGLAWAAEDGLNPWHLVSGAGPQARDEVVVDAGTARRGGLSVGQQLEVALADGRHRYRLVGVAALGEREAPAGSTVVFFAPEEAELALGTGDQLDMVLADAARGVDASLVAQRLRRDLPASLEVLTASQLDQVEGAELDRGLVWLRRVLGAFVAVALAAAALLIANTFAVLVAQRGRELALLRALGAQRRQVSALALAEASALGALGSVAGVGLGLGLAHLLAAGLGAAGWDTTAWSLGLDWRSVVVPVALGLSVTVAGAALPAWRAGRLAPLAAVRELAAEPRRPGVARTLAGLAALGVAAVVLAVAGSGEAPVGVGLAGASGMRGTAGLVLGGALGVVGVVLAGPALVAPGLRLAGHQAAAVALLAVGALVSLAAAGVALASLADRFLPGLAVAAALGLAAVGLVVGGRSGRGTAARLARSGLGREPRRVAATVGSLVVGVGVASTLLVLAASVRSSVGRAVSATFLGDFVVVEGEAGALPGGGSGLSPQLARDLGAVPGVAVASGIRLAHVEVAGQAQAVPAVDGASLAPIFDVGLDAGSVADLGRDGLAVHVGRARAEGWALGDPVTVAFPTTGPETFHVVALYRNADLTGDLLLGVEALAARQADAGDAQVFVGLEGDVDRGRMRTTLTDVLARYPSARLLDPGEYRHEQEARVDQALELALALVALAIAIAVVGVANTLSLGTVERRRELGLLRAVGASGAQVRALVRWEAVAVCLVGSVAGVAVGLVLAWATLRALGQGGYRQVEVPVLQLAGVVVAAGLAGVAAAALPARRAARVDVIEALAAD